MVGKSEVWLSDSSTYVNACRGWNQAASKDGITLQVLISLAPFIALFSIYSKR